MPTANQIQGQLLCLMGPAGSGKSEFVMQAPQPHAILCVDKPVIATLPDGFPSYDPAQSFGKFYPPPAKDLTNAEALPSRNVFDQILQDIEALKAALYADKGGLVVGQESWPMPHTIIVEGMDFVRDHCINWVLNTQSKHNMDEFGNVFLGWGLVAAKMAEVFDNLAFLPSVRPINVVVTVGIDEESKTIRNDKGKTEIIKTGNFDPGFGGKMSQEGPRKFRDCWLTERVSGSYMMVTAPNAAPRYEKYRGLRSGRFGLKPIEDVTLKPPYTNQWQRLFGSNTNL